MIEAILPAAVAVAEAQGDVDPGGLMPEEEALMSRAVEKRRREFAGGRDCARAALAQLGRQPGPILSGERGEPLWPEGIVGSITHCDGYWGAAVARSADLASLGVDAEPHAPLPDGLIRTVARPEERRRLADLAGSRPDVHWDRLLFSAKESVYKAWFPLTGLWLGLEDARVELEPARHTFEAQLLVEGPRRTERRIDRFDGRWLVRDGLLCTAVAVTG